MFRRACNYRLRQAIVDFADGSRQANPWAQDVYARAWLRVIWRCWTDHTPYDPARHSAAVASHHQHTGTPEPTPMAS